MPRALVIRLQNRSLWHFSDFILQMRLILTRGLSTLSLSEKCLTRQDTLHSAALPTAPDAARSRGLGTTDRVRSTWPGSFADIPVLAFHVELLLS